MPPLKAIETLAEIVADSGTKILPSRMAEVFESLSDKVGLTANKAIAQAGTGLEGRSAASMLSGELNIAELPALQAKLTAERAAITKANDALVNHVTSVMPQVQDGELDWILGGSSAGNALAGARSLTILDSASLPAIVPARTVELSDDAIAGFQSFVRQVGDIDAFIVNGGKNRYLTSPYVGSIEMSVPESASGALKHTGEARSTSLIQGVKMQFDQPEVAAIDIAGNTTYVTGPGQMLGNKLRQVLMGYSPAEAGKLTGDFSHLLDAASNIYSQPELVQFGKQAIERNSLLYRYELTVPWEQSANNAKYLGFLRKVLEAEEQHGSFLKGLNVDTKDSIATMKILERHPNVADKTAITEFINRHADFVRGLDVKGSPERSLYLQQGGGGKASEKFMALLYDVKPEPYPNSVADQLRFFDSHLSQNSNLPQLAKLARQM